MMQGSFNISIKQFETSLLGYGEEGVAFWGKKSAEIKITITGYDIFFTEQ